MSLAAGELNRYITIQRKTTEKDSFGQLLDTWEDVASIYAAIRGSTGMGAIRAQQGVGRSVSQYSIRVRHRTDVDANMRVLWGGILFSIVQVRHDLDRLEWTDMVCEEGGNDG